MLPSRPPLQVSHRLKFLERLGKINVFLTLSFLVLTILLPKLQNQPHSLSWEESFDIILQTVIDKQSQSPSWCLLSQI